jgi:glycosyltransferase involved in cell wall biosynthesis
VIVHDNASDAATARTLDKLEYPRLAIHHATANSGFGEGVNQGMAHAQAPYALVLNSDTEATHDFVAPLVAALRADAELAAVSPSGNTFRRYDLERYRRRSGCVVSYSIWAYAFLVRRAVFQDVGGFDPVFGLGYFEDMDLSRRLVDRGWWFGVHPEATLAHVGHASFGDQMGGLLARNRHIYHERYPEARRQVILVTGDIGLDAFPPELVAEVGELLRRGGQIHWLRPTPPDGLLAVQMHGHRLHPVASPAKIWRARHKAYRSFTDLWTVDGAPAVSLALLRAAGAALGLPFRTWSN